MIEIIKARNNAEPVQCPDDFDPSPFQPHNSTRDHSSSKHDKADSPSRDSTFAVVSAPPPVSKPTHSSEGFLLSTSARPGGSRFQHVQVVPKTQKFCAIIPHNGKRHSYGPFSSELEAAAKVKEFFDNLQQGQKVPTRGEKRTDMFHQQLTSQLNALNKTAKNDNRHFVENSQNPTCCFCHQTVHTYHALKFAQKLCPSLTSLVDKKGSATRAQKLSQTRTAALEEHIKTHNLTATSKKQNYILSYQPPKCKFCLQTVCRGYLRQWMVKQCPHAPDNVFVKPVENPKPSRRITGKQAVP